MFNQNFPTVNIFRDWFNNPALPDSFYEKIIRDWSYYSLDKFKRKIKLFLELDCLTVFNLATLELYKYQLQSNTEDFFSHIKYKDYCFDPIFIFNDIIAINEIEKEISAGKNQGKLNGNQNKIKSNQTNITPNEHQDNAHGDMSNETKPNSNDKSKVKTSSAPSIARVQGAEMLIYLGGMVHLPRINEFIMKYYRNELL